MNTSTTSTAYASAPDIKGVPLPSWMRVSLDELGDLTRRLFLKLDYPIEQTEIIVRILAYAHRLAVRTLDSYERRQGRATRHSA